MHDCILLLITDIALFILELRDVFEVIRQILLLAICPQLWPQSWFAEESNLPVQFSRHLAAFAETLQFGYLGVHAAWVLEHLTDWQFHFTNDVIGGAAVRIPEFHAQAFIGLD